MRVSTATHDDVAPPNGIAVREETFTGRPDNAPPTPTVPADDAQDAGTPEPGPRGLTAHCRHWWSRARARYAVARPDQGMSTAEYAVGTIAACAFAALLFKVVSSPEVQEMLSSLIDRALNTAV